MYTSEEETIDEIPCSNIISNWILSEKQGRELRNYKENSSP